MKRSKDRHFLTSPEHGVISNLVFLSLFVVRNNCERDAVLVGVINSATSLYASIPVFSILGFKATTALNACKDEYVSMLILGGVLQLRLCL